ncbi:MAG: aminotransferase class V-fold PLP-dependent enzyme [Candidatus Kapabacteria bacterium]|nr:aminotransferase class V-fold PLP-dependent enzyme [Candidatus Kapabacteria bacterium]
MTNEQYFKQFRDEIIGIDQTFDSPYGLKKIIYADWTASGRMYKPIEDVFMQNVYGFVANTHTEATVSGKTMTLAYHEAHKIIKKHVNAGNDDIILTPGTGMTGAVNKFQRILGLKAPEQLQAQLHLKEEDKPVVFVTHMEHHSNHTSWLVTIADVVNLNPDDNGLVDLADLEKALILYKDRKMIIGAFTACSNVTGIQTNYYEMAALLHKYGGYCFVDFAASAPYININMHPDDETQKLDAIFFSPHKFLGGPGSSGVLIFDSALYKNKIPEQVGGGTVNWTNPWGEHSFIEDIETREDGGTPGFLQTIRAALAIKLKEKMGVERILLREEEILQILFSQLRNIDKLHILADNIEKRLAIISFYVEGIHYNLIVKLLNDLFGIQTRGGCSCAGTYGHYLLQVGHQKSDSITSSIETGCLIGKPGWVRASFHPTMTDKEIYYICYAIKYVIENSELLEKGYDYSEFTNEFTNNKKDHDFMEMINNWYKF